MRVIRVNLPAFKNLRDFEISFDKYHPTTLIVGRNGTGKSNLLEALVRIFRDLDRGFKGEFKTKFPFEIEYEIRSRVVKITHNPALKRSTIFRVDNEVFSQKSFLESEGRLFLPETVFAYYSGPSNRLEELFEKSLVEFRDAMIRNEKSVRQRLIYGRLIHSKFVLLSFFGESDADSAKFLNEELGIEELESVLFVLKEPYWGEKQGVAAKDKFWGATGVVRRLLDRLRSEALAPLMLQVGVPAGIKRKSREERVFLYIRDKGALRRIVSEVASEGDQGSARELFKTLESAYVSDLISDIRINVRKRSSDDTITFRELSEGEQQLLMVLGLLRFTRDEESLFLLDEPDTHLNPVWSQRYSQLIEQTVARNDSSHVLFATHDPVAVSMLSKEQVRQLEVGSDGLTRARQPQEDPIKEGAGGVLMSELFGLRSLYSPVVDELFEKRHRLLAKEKLSQDEQIELAKTTYQLSEIDFSSATPDPLYAKFLQAMSKLDRDEISDKPVLSPSEVREQREIAEQAVRGLIRRDDAE